MKMNSKTILSLFFAIALTGCNSNSTETANQKKESSASGTKTVAFVNTHCPIMMGKIDPKGATTTWQGKTVGYCCDECKGEFEKLSDNDKKKSLAKAETDGVDVDHDDLDHDHGDHDHGNKDDHDKKEDHKHDHDHDKKTS